MLMISCFVDVLFFRVCVLDEWIVVRYCICLCYEVVIIDIVYVLIVVLIIDNR